MKSEWAQSRKSPLFFFSMSSWPAEVLACVGKRFSRTRTRVVVVVVFFSSIERLCAHANTLAAIVRMRENIDSAYNTLIYYKSLLHARRGRCSAT